MSRERYVFGISIFALLFFWSSGYTAVCSALKEFSPEGLALFSFLISSIALLVIAATGKIRIPEKNDLITIILCGVMGIGIYQLILMNGQKLVSTSTAAVLIGTYPVFITILSGIILKEAFNLGKLLGVCISFSGVALISLGENPDFTINHGAIMLLLGAFIVSIVDLFQKKLMDKYKPIELTAYFIWTGTIVLMLFSPSLVKDLSSVSIEGIFSGLYLGFCSRFMCYVIWAKLISKYSIVFLSGFCYAVPFFTMLLAFLFLKELPNQFAIPGAIIVVSGLVIVTNGSKVMELIQKPLKRFHPSFHLKGEPLPRL